MENFILPIFNAVMGGSAYTLYQKVSTFAGYFVHAETFDDGKRARFAVRLAYPVRAPLDAIDLENGGGIDANRYPALDGERKKIQAITASVLERYAPLYVKAKDTLTAFELDSGGGASSSSTASGGGTSTSSGNSTNRDLFAVGTAVATSARPSGEQKREESTSAYSETNSAATSTSSQKTDATGTLEMLGRYKDGELENIEKAIIDALFEALFVEIEHNPEYYEFGDLRVKMWG